MSTPEPAASRPAPRCNADYRWTTAKVTAFLKALGRCGKVAEAARSVGMSRQAAYRLKARLADPRFQQTFELARRTGQAARAQARAEERAARAAASPWGAPGMAALDYLRGDGGRAQGIASAAQGDGGAPHGDTSPAQGDGPGRQGYTRAAVRARRAAQAVASARQGDGLPPQGDGSAGEVTK